MNIKQLNVVFSAETIDERLKGLAMEIDAMYKDEPLVMICVLKGAFIFFSDLVKHVTINPEIDFVRVASYGVNTESSKTISFTKDIELSIKDKHVVLVDDIIDSGHTMTFLKQQMAARGARSLRVAALIDKRERRELNVTVDFAGFALSEGFLVGYGLDYAEKFRNLPAIYRAELT